MDLARFGEIDSSNMRDKVERIIKGYLDGPDMCQGIVDAFDSERAVRILAETSSPQKRQEPGKAALSPSYDSKKIDA